MIHYNMRYRGPYEYEKFILNVLQYSNNAHDFSSEVNGLEEYETLKAKESKIGGKLRRGYFLKSAMKQSI